MFNIFCSKKISFLTYGSYKWAIVEKRFMGVGYSTKLIKGPRIS